MSVVTIKVLLLTLTQVVAGITSRGIHRHFLRPHLRAPLIPVLQEGAVFAMMDIERVGTRASRTHKVARFNMVPIPTEIAKIVTVRQGTSGTQQEQRVLL